MPVHIVKDWVPRGGKSPRSINFPSHIPNPVGSLRVLETHAPMMSVLADDFLEILIVYTLI